MLIFGCLSLDEISCIYIMLSYQSGKPQFIYFCVEKQYSESESWSASELAKRRISSADDHRHWSAHCWLSVCKLLLWHRRAFRPARQETEARRDPKAPKYWGNSYSNYGVWGWLRFPCRGPGWTPSSQVRKHFIQSDSRRWAFPEIPRWAFRLQQNYM